MPYPVAHRAEVKKPLLIARASSSIATALKTSPSSKSWPAAGLTHGGFYSYFP